METLKKILAILSAQERKRFALLFGIVLIMSLLDVLGVASILPFMAVLANPGLVETNVILATIYQTFGFTDSDQFLFFLGGAVFLLLVLSLSFKAFTTYAQLRFSLMREYSIGRRFIEGYLHQPYVWFLNHHSADISKTILSEVGTFVGNGLMPLITVIAQSVVVVAMLILLLFVDPLLALTVGIVLSIAYGLIIKVMSKFLLRIGKERLEVNKQRFKIVSEAFGSIKEIKVGGLERTYVQRFSDPAATYARHSASSQVVAQLPRYFLEAIAFGGMLLVILYLMANNTNLDTALPIIALYALAGYRLMPALQLIYSNLTKLRFVGPALDALHADLSSLVSIDLFDNHSENKIILQRQMSLDNIIFNYPEAAQSSLNKISLTIPACSTIGLVGSTGSGKTTMMDLMLGLLEPQQGTLTVDDQVINDSNRRQWQKSVGYVPQQIYLADDSIAANIAFGVEPCNIDQSAVEHAAKISSLHEFVVNELPQGYATKVGERGVRLSGGQRQRIGIARALYHNPNILFLDEATSALDNLTEQAVMDAIRSLQHKITIVIIAHRLNTVRQCDHIYILNKGQVEAQGTYNDLMQKNETFQAMASSEGK
jgi:ABC-type bacteriocin/lantibiotic exporter with double-glycine peptidase domain